MLRILNENNISYNPLTRKDQKISALVKKELNKIKNNQVFEEKIDYNIDIPYFGLLFNLIERFRSFKLFKQMIETEPKIISSIYFTSFTKEEFEQFCPNQKPSNGKLPWVYEFKPDYKDKIKVLLPSFLASQLESKYFPDFLFPFVRKELFSLPEKTNYQIITDSLDKITNLEETELKIKLNETLNNKIAITY